MSYRIKTTLMKPILSLAVAAFMLCAAGVASADRAPVPKQAYKEIISSAKKSGMWSNNPRLRIADHTRLNRSFTQVTAVITGDRFGARGPARPSRAIGTFKVHFSGAVTQVGEWAVPAMAAPPRPANGSR